MSTFSTAPDTKDFTKYKEKLCTSIALLTRKVERQPGGHIAEMMGRPFPNL